MNSQGLQPARHFIAVCVFGQFGSPCGRRIRQLKWRGPMCHSSAGSLGYCCIGSHHRSNSSVATEDCTLRSDQPPSRRSRSRRGALSYRNAHRYHVPVSLKRIKLSKGPAWRQGGWVAMAQIDGLRVYGEDQAPMEDFGSGRDSESP